MPGTRRSGWGSMDPRVHDAARKPPSGDGRFAGRFARIGVPLLAVLATGAIAAASTAPIPPRANVTLGTKRAEGGAGPDGGCLALDGLEQRGQLERLDQDGDLTLAQEALRVRVRNVPRRDHELGIPRQAAAAELPVPLRAAPICDPQVAQHGLVFHRLEQQEPCRSVRGDIDVVAVPLQDPLRRLANGLLVV